MKGNIRKLLTLKENSLESIYSFLGIVVTPTAAIAVSLFTSYFTDDVSLPRGIIMLSIFIFIVSIAFLISTNQNNKKNMEQKLKSETETLQNKINDQRSQIDKLELDIKDHTKGLWREFGPLNSYKKNEYLLSLFEQFAESYSSIISIQLYNYFEQRDSEHTEMKIKHSLAHVMEGKSHNALQQHYYVIETELLKKYEDALYQYRGKAPDHDEGLLDLYVSIADELDKLDPSKVTMVHAMKFAILILIQDILAETEPYKKQKVSVITNEEVETELFSLIRTGIFRGLLYDKMFYEFNYIKTNKTVNDKSERTYLTIKSGLTNGKQSIIVVTIDNQGREVDVKEMGLEFMQMLIDNGFER